MPVRAPKPCSRCKRLITGDCPVCTPIQRKAYDASRGSSAERGYDSNWRRFRVSYLRSHPICKCGSLATDIHHIVMLRDGGSKYDHNNLAALCKRCHSSITSKEVR